MKIIKRIIGIYFNLLSYVFPSHVGKQSFYLFCIPFKGKLKEKHQSFLNTAEKKDLLVEDNKVSTYKWGSGPKKVLLVHGWQSYAYRWRKYIEQLDKTKYSIICFDAPGHGNSEGLYCNVPLYEKTLKEVVSTYGKPDTIVAHSIGAFSSLYFLSKNNFKVEKFISMAPPFAASQFFKVYRSELRLNNRVIKNLEAYFNKYTGHPSSYFSTENFAPSIQANCLLIHDQGDKMTSHENSVKLKGFLPSAELWITEGYGHKLGHIEVVERVVEFIE